MARHVDHHAGRPLKARGATSNAASARYAPTIRETDGDWIDLVQQVDGSLPPVKTSVTPERPRTIIARNNSPDIGFDQSINAYRGCEHGCIYCFARPTHAWHDLSPGIDFETKLFAKPDAAKLLERELSARNYKVSPIAMGTNTDPYQPIERDWRITRQCIETLAQCRHPLLITTKSDRVLRDIDLLGAMAADDLVAVGVSITSFDPVVARTLEPRAPHPAKRLEAIRQLSQAGIFVAVCVSPIIPAITDGEMEGILERAAAAGAKTATFIPVRLPHEVAPLFRAWLETHYPDRAAKVMNIIRDMRGGRDNDPGFGSRMRGQGVWADLLRSRFTKARRRYGLDDKRPPLRCDLFRPPAGPQLSLF